MSEGRRIAGGQELSEEERQTIQEMEKTYTTEYEVGQDNVSFFGLDLHNPVFFASALLVFVFVALSLIFPAAADTGLNAARSWIGRSFDWLFVAAGNVFVLFCLSLIVLPYGKIRLGGSDAAPDFSYPSWLAMLFAAGMGIGLMFWAVAEPVGYFTEWFGTPLNVGGGDAGASLGATMYHWGLHPWAIYGVVALSLGFFSYNKGMPLTIRSTLYPLLGDRVWGRLGDAVDILAVLATLFGLATSLGLGARQAVGGMELLFGLDGGLAAQLTVVAVVTAVALVSVLRGIEGGVRVMSNLNMLFAIALLVFVVAAGGLAAFVNNAATALGGYAEYMLPLSNPVGRSDETFYHGWTIFFWAWWISWSPFVGMFIARVSRGRTVREVAVAVLVVPVVVTLLWMSAFGGTGIDQVRSGVGELADGIGNSSLALFQMLENLPFSGLTSTLAIGLVLMFFVTSSDSGSLVVDSITAGGKTDAPRSQRVFWAVVEGVIAAVLLAVGGETALSALQAGAVSTGLPFVLVLLAMCVSLAKGLRNEWRLLKYRPPATA